MQPRREFLKRAGMGSLATLLPSLTFAIPHSAGYRKPLRIGFITDLHHLQFGKNEEQRMQAFMNAVMQEKPDFILQCGDFCRPKGSDRIMAEWERFTGPKYHVIGNHDMDVCDKATIMTLWGMKSRYYSFDTDGFHFVVLDRNYLRDGNGNLAHYDTSNWGPLPAEQRSFTDPEQLEWLKQDLAEAKYPTIVFMHQPVFLSEWANELGNAEDILSIFDLHNYTARQSGSNATVCAVFMGHDHDDRYGERNGVHYFIINSASYVYTDTGAHYYNDSLFAFITLDPSGKLHIEGRSSSYPAGTPEKVMAVYQPRISDRSMHMFTPKSKKS